LGVETTAVGALPQPASTKGKMKMNGNLFMAKG
jgi:hypothetical protein